MNAVDLYQITEREVRNGRLDYNRSKTQGKRKDNAFISIKIVDEAKPLLEKDLGKLCERYLSANCLNLVFYNLYNCHIRIFRCFEHEKSVAGVCRSFWCMGDFYMDDYEAKEKTLVTIVDFLQFLSNQSANSLFIFKQRVRSMLFHLR